MIQNDMISGYVGQDPVQALYLGSELIWSASQPTPPLAYILTSDGDLIQGSGSLDGDGIGQFWFDFTGSTAATFTLYYDGNIVTGSTGTLSYNYYSVNTEQEEGGSSCEQVDGVDYGSVVEDIPLVYDTGWTADMNHDYSRVQALLGIQNYSYNFFTADIYCYIEWSCEEPDPGCCWDTRYPAVYELCGCDFERLVDQMVATWYDDNGGENNLYIRYADDKDYYGEVIDENGDMVGNYIIFNQGDEVEFPIGNNNSIFVVFNTDEYCLEIYTGNGVALEEVAGFHLETPTACDFCQDWEEMGYESREDCLCQEYYGGGCQDCENWESRGYESFEDCMCQEYGSRCAPPA